MRAEAGWRPMKTWCDSHHGWWDGWMNYS
jgi:hypothetical protein